MMLLDMFSIASMIVAGTAASPTTTSMKPSAIFHRESNIFAAHNELLRRMVARNPLTQRRIQTEEASCPGTPFLWKIIEDATGNHVGFGVGSMHLPGDVVSTEEAYYSIISAIGGVYINCV
jgi:hypothetical protein